MLDARDLRVAEHLDGEGFWSSIGLLVAIVEIAPDDADTSLACEALERLVAKAQDARAAALLDWWLVSRLGRRSQGPAFDLGRFVQSPLLELMNRMLDQSRTDGVASLPGLRAKRRLASKLEDFARELHHEQGKVGSQGVTWDDIEKIYRPVYEQLRIGGRPTAPSTSVSEVRALMRDHEVRRSSDIWRKIERDWDRLDTLCREACDLAALPDASYEGILPDRISTGYGVTSNAAFRVERLLLSDLVDPAEDPEQILEEALLTLSAADPRDREWLAALTISVCPPQRPGPALLAPDHARMRRCEKEISRLEKSGADVDIARVALSEGSISDAESAIEEARELRANADRRRNLREEHRKLVDLATEANADEEILHELELAEADIEDGALEEATEKIRQLREDLSTQIEANRLDRIRVLIDELVRLGSPVEDSIVQRAAEGRVGEDDLVLLQDAYDQAEVSVKVRVEERLRVGVGRLENERQLLDDQIVRTIDQLLAGARSAVTLGSMAVADEQSRRALVLLDQALPRAWQFENEQSEGVLVQHLEDYVTNRLGFATHDIARLYVSLKTKRFVVLAGLTGSGKTTIARLFAEALGATASNGRFVRVAVRPNWVDESEVLGYVNPITRRFEPGWLAGVIRLCERTPDLPVFCLLDEMNLAPVEFYLADYLSALEEATAGADTTISLYSSASSVDNSEEWPPTLVFPENLFLIGTVNVDESTRALSDRVLDRGNVIQLAVTVNDRHHRSMTDRDLEPRWQVRMRDWRAACAAEPAAHFHDFLVQVGEVLSDRMRLGMGVRAHVEIERFVANSIGVLDEARALDFAILQRVLPKIRGFRRDLESGLEELHDLFADRGLERSHRVVESWLDDRVSADDYIDGAHASVGLVTSG
jgi:MoxR-like ATPase